jgi:hypothetical protein
VAAMGRLAIIASEIYDFESAKLIKENMKVALEPWLGGKYRNFSITVA